MVYGVIFSLSFPHFAWATEAIIELDFQDSQKSQQLHVIPRLSNIGDVSHVELDTKKQQVIVHRINQYNKNQHGNEYSEEDQQGGFPLSLLSLLRSSFRNGMWLIFRGT